MVGAALHLPSWHFDFPWQRHALLSVGLPLVAVLVATIGTRSRLPLVRRLGQ
jgi:hypothetical protein